MGSVSRGRKINTVFPWAVASQGGQDHEYKFTKWRQLVGFLWFVNASIFFHLLMQAIEVEEHFHVQHAYATQSDRSYLKSTKLLNIFSGNASFK